MRRQTVSEMTRATRAGEVNAGDHCVSAALYARTSELQSPAQTTATSKLAANVAKVNTVQNPAAHIQLSGSSDDSVSHISTLGASEAAAQCIVIGPVCGFVHVFAGVFVALLPR